MIDERRMKNGGMRMQGEDEETKPEEEGGWCRSPN